MPYTLALPYITVLDQNGDPISGAYIRFYVTGTDTLKDVFTDSTMSQVLTQPVRTDSAGRAKAFLSGTYRVVVADQNEVVIDTTDGVVGGEGSSGTVDLQTATVIASKSDKAIPLINLLTPKYNPKNYASFIGDGLSSDQAAVDAMMADIAMDVGTRRFIAIELPSDAPVRASIRRLASGASDTWRNVYIDGNNSELIGNTKPATLTGVSPLSGDGILSLQYIDGLNIRNLRVNGLCYNTITSLTQTAGVATATTAEVHNLVTGEYLAIMDVLTDSINNPIQRMRDETYNGAKFITVTGSNTFTFPVHVNATATPVITYAKCTFKSTQFGGDNIRLVSCTRVIMSDIDSRHCNDHAIYFVSTTNSANTTDSTLQLNGNNIQVTNIYMENVTQSSSTPSGVRELQWTNITARYFRGGSVKFASHLINGELQIANLQCFDFSNVGNGTTPNGFILEGGQRVYLDGFNFNRAGGLIILPNPTSGRIGQRTLKDVTISNGSITECGYCYAQTLRRENHAVVVGDNAVTVGADAVNNVTIRNVDILRPYGRGYQLGNNNAGTLKSVRVIGGSVMEPALQGVVGAARNSENMQVDGVTFRKTAASGGAGGLYPQVWTSGTTYSFFDVVYVPASFSYVRKTNAGSQVSTVQPDPLNGNVLADGCQWKNLFSNSAIIVGPIESTAVDFSDNPIVKNNKIEEWPSGNGIDIIKARYGLVEENTLSKVGTFGINISNTQNTCVNKNTVLQSGFNPINSGNNIDLVVQDNYLDSNGDPRTCANFNNEDGLLYTGNTHANSASNLSPLGTNLNNIRRVRAYGNFSKNCLRKDRLFPAMAARRRNLDDSFFEYTHEVGLSNNEAVMMTTGAFIKNGSPGAGKSSQIYVTAGGYNTRTLMQSNLSATGLTSTMFSSTVMTSAAFTGAPAAFNWTGRQPTYAIVGNNGAGTPTSGASAVPADYFGIPDGNTINSCGHWLWLSWNDFGYALLADGESINYETGKTADGFPNARQSGTVITAMSYDSGTGVVTCTAAGHGLTNGERYSIARCYPTAFQVNADANTDGIKDTNPVTVIDPNTFSYTVATGLTPGPVMGIVLIKSDGTIQGNCSITSSGTTATMTAVGHGRITGNQISVRMATDDLYNVTGVTCTVIDADTLTYTMTGTPAASPAVSRDRLVLFGTYWSEAPNARTTGAGGGFTKPQTRGIPWGDYFVEFYGPRAQAERLEITPYRATVTVNPGTVASGATVTSANLTLSGINGKMTARCTSIDNLPYGLEARVAIVALNTYRIIWYNATAGSLTPGDLTYEVEVFNTLPWSGTEGVS